MGKTQKAIEKAEKENKVSFLFKNTENFDPEDIAPVIPVEVPEKVRSYDTLKTNLLVRASRTQPKSIMFTSLSQGGGCSTTATQFAVNVARNSDLKILLADVNFRTPNIHHTFNLSECRGLSDFIHDIDRVNDGTVKVGPGNLFVLPVGNNRYKSASFLETKQFTVFIQTLRTHFDYIVLDAPPASLFPETLVFSGVVDGVVLIIDAGKVRKQVALKTKNEIINAGGKIIGIVLNKRKYYIPDWIYKRI